MIPLLYLSLPKTLISSSLEPFDRQIYNEKVVKQVMDRHERKK